MPLTSLAIPLIMAVCDDILEPHGHVLGLPIIVQVALLRLIRLQRGAERGVQRRGDGGAGDSAVRPLSVGDSVTEGSLVGVDGVCTGEETLMSPVQLMMSCSWVAARERMPEIFECECECNA
jgi:hypothetical protein